jgi:hypothetical protein
MVECGLAAGAASIRSPFTAAESASTYLFTDVACMVRSSTKPEQTKFLICGKGDILGRPTMTTHEMATWH